MYPGPPAVTALHPTDLQLNAGEHLAIVGPSGSGKSTLLNVLGLLDRPTSGRYDFDGLDVSTLTEAERTALRAQRIGFVFQAFHLLAYRTALENVQLGQLYTHTSRPARRAAAEQALAAVGLAHRRHALPSTMSGGESQRVAIARAIVGSPAVLLCDEPTGNLDTATAESVLDLLRDLHATGMTLIVITHDTAVAARAKRLVSIRDGHVTERHIDSYTDRSPTSAPAL